MISIESEVLQRHLDFFKNKSVLLAGGVNDDFLQQLQKISSSVLAWSCYFDYAQGKRGVHFSPIFEQSSDVIVFYWTKNKQEVHFQLSQLLSHSPLQQTVFIIGENRCGVRSVEKILSPYGEVVKIDSARRCGLYHFSLQKKPHFHLEDYWKCYSHSKLKGLNVYSLPGVFSRQELDAGTDLLLSTIDNHIRGKVLDMGCGAGVIGAFIKSQNPKADVVMTDIYSMALESAKRTLAENNLQAEVYPSNVFSHIQEKFDLIISNPPFHDGVDTNYYAVRELIEKAKWHLKTSGELRIVANAFLPYPTLFERYFGYYEVIAKTNKFKVYSVRS